MKLRDYRKKVGLTQKELSRLIEVNRVIVCRYETGVRRPSVDVVQRYAKALNISTDELIQAIESPLGIIDRMKASIENLEITIKDSPRIEMKQV